MHGFVDSRQGLSSVERYLSDAAFEHFEYMDGVPVELNVGSGPHGRHPSELLDASSPLSEEDASGPSRDRATLPAGARATLAFILPDVSVVLGRSELLRPETRFLDRAPEFVIEIRSPDDSLPRLFRKIDDYFADGTRLAWLVLPEESCVLALAPGTPHEDVHARGKTRMGAKCCPAWKSRLDEIFA